MKSIYTPNDFKDLASDAKMIQAAVDAAAEAGVSVVIPRFNERTEKPLWEIDETIVLHTGSDVQLEGCHIRLADDTFIHFFSNDAAYGKYWRADERQYDITLTGRGNVLLDGGKHNGIFEKDFTIYDENGNFVGRANPRGIENISVNRGINFRNVERIAVSGLRFINQRYWAMNFEFCAEGHLFDITFDAPANVPNQDGIDALSATSESIQAALPLLSLPSVSASVSPLTVPSPISRAEYLFSLHAPSESMISSRPRDTAVSLRTFTSPTQESARVTTRSYIFPTARSPQARSLTIP